MHYDDEGPFTGEISPLMLREIGVNLIEIGHSERRAYYNESDYTVNKKVLASLGHGFIPLVCVGETLDEKNFCVTREVIGRQMKIALDGVHRDDVTGLWLAYEPVWAIGAIGTPASPEYAADVHGFMRSVLTDLYGAETAGNVPLLYGGSVNIENAVPLIKQTNIDGLFIGRSAWDIDTFKLIAELIAGS